MIREKWKQFFEEHRLAKWKIRTKLAVLILVMATVSLSVYNALWVSQRSVCLFLEKTGIVTFFDEEKFVGKLRAEAVKYRVPLELEEAQWDESRRLF